MQLLYILSAVFLYLFLLISTILVTSWIIRYPFLMITRNESIVKIFDFLRESEERKDLIVFPTARWVKSKHQEKLSTLIWQFLPRFFAYIISYLLIIIAILITGVIHEDLFSITVAISLLSIHIIALLYVYRRVSEIGL